MASLRMRLTAGSDATQALIKRVTSVEGIESVEEVADLMPHMDDPDSSSRGLPDDIGPGTHSLRIEAGEDAIRRALEVAKESAQQLGIVLEVEELS